MIIGGGGYDHRGVAMIIGGVAMTIGGSYEFVRNTPLEGTVQRLAIKSSSPVVSDQVNSVQIEGTTEKSNMDRLMSENNTLREINNQINQFYESDFVGV